MQASSSQANLETIRYREIEQVLQEERRNMHTLEMQVRDANRREDVLKTEVERHRLRVESKLDV